MSVIVQRCLNAVRTMPLGSGFDIPWRVMEEFALTTGSPVLPIFDFSEDKIKQTAARVVFALMLLTPFCKAAGWCNAALGGLHLGWCICNIKSFQNKSIERSELEKAFIRVSTAVYDLAIVYLLSFHFIGSDYLKGALLLSLALSPQQVLQLHHAIFAKAEISKPDAPASKTIDHHHLRKDCLINVFSSGLTDTILPPETKVGWGARLLSLPAGLGSYTASTYRSFAATILRTK